MRNGLELKFADVAHVGVLQNDTGMVDGEQDPLPKDCLNSIDEGTGEENRTGRRIVIDSVYVKGCVFISGGTGTFDPAFWNQPSIFLAMYLDKESNNQVDPPVTNLLFKNPTGTNFASTRPLKNMSWYKRFTVLKSVHLNFCGNISITGDNVTEDKMILFGGALPFELYHKFKDGLEVTYSGTGGEVTDITDNALHMVGWTSSEEIGPLLEYNCRVRFWG